MTTEFNVRLTDTREPMLAEPGKIGRRGTAACFMFTVVLAGVLLLCCIGTSQAATPQEREILFQVSTIDALLKGGYDGAVSMGELKKHGDLGIGTLDGLDGELIVVDGQAYQITVDGIAHAAPDAAQTPFVALTFFEPDITLIFENVSGLDDLSRRIAAALPASQAFYAIRVEQTFDAVTARSVPRQSKPYPPLAEAVKQQAVFAFRDAAGVMAGLFCPGYVGTANVPGLHLHFLTADKTRGGHVLNLQAAKLTVTLDRTDRLDLLIPEGLLPAGNSAASTPDALNSIER